MKKLIIFLFLMFTLTSCSIESKNKLSIDDSILSTSIENPISFEIERTTLSKGFQSVIPNVEIIEKETEPAFLVNLGIIQCTKINIDKITLKDNSINIYVSRTIEYDKTDIVVPQILVKLNDFEREKLRDIKFNIINSNYETIKVNFDRNHVLDNIYAQFKLTSNTIPKVNLGREDRKYIWDIAIHNSFSKELPNSPIVYFTAKVDSATGEFIETNSYIVSDTIDEGKIIEHVSGSPMLYVQNSSNDNGNLQNLWLYDIEKNEKTNIFSTSNKIYTAKFNFDFSKIAVIEHNDNFTDIYVIDIEKNETRKVTPLDYKHIWMVKWYGNNLYGVSNDMNSNAKLILFDLEKNQYEALFSINQNVSDFDVYDNNFVFTEFNMKDNTQNLIIFNNGVKLETIESSYNPMFIDSNRILYQRNIVDQDKRTLWIYDMSNDSTKAITDMDIRTSKVINSNTLLLVSRENYSTELDLSIYDLSNDTLETLAKVITETIYYNKNNNSIYFNTIPSVENPNTDLIYSINLDDIPQVKLRKQLK